MKILETERTILREIVKTDAEFILDLLNQPSFIRYIGDRNVRTIDEARDYIESRFTENYKKFGFGMWAVELKATRASASMSKSALTDERASAFEIAPMGICGFVKRDSLPDVDIGFAFLPQYARKGYAFESAATALEYGRDVLQLKRILAITSKDNESSGRLLGKLNFKFERLTVLPGDDEELKLFTFPAS